jgi:DNA modification methylase
MGEATNTLHYGDNLDIRKRYIDDGSVDLIYLDPPFNSNADPTSSSPEGRHAGSRPDQSLRRHLDLGPGSRAGVRRSAAQD